jgi:threonyl-tRNA synthetase
MLILGDKELEEGNIAVRERKEGDIGAMPLAEFKEMLDAKRASRSL